MHKRLLFAMAGIITLNLTSVVPALASGNNSDRGTTKHDQPAASKEKPQQASNSRAAEAADAKQPPAQQEPESKSKSKTHQIKSPSTSAPKPTTSKTAQAASHNPPGNNGTIKIDAEPFDTHPNNQPHVGCRFQVDFYNFDQGQYSADVTFEAHPPTGSGVLLHDRVFIGADPAGGGRDVDAQKTYDLASHLAGITPHHKQGYHVKLTVNAEGSIGADTKHKVFWVQGCLSPGKGGGFTPTTTSKINSGLGGTPDRPAKIASIQPMGGGVLPNTGGMLDLLLAAILAAGFAGGARARQILRENRHLH